MPLFCHFELFFLLFAQEAARVPGAAHASPHESGVHGGPDATQGAACCCLLHLH